MGNSKLGEAKIAGTATYNGQPFSAVETAYLLQNCMIIAGIGTLIQLFPIWKIGSGLPVVMGISFTFLAACLSTASQDYGIMVAGVFVVGLIMELCLPKDPARYEVQGDNAPAAAEEKKDNE